MEVVVLESRINLHVILILDVPDPIFWDYIGYIVIDFRRTGGSSLGQLVLIYYELGTLERFSTHHLQVYGYP